MNHSAAINVTFILEGIDWTVLNLGTNIKQARNRVPTYTNFHFLISYPLGTESTLK